MKPVLVPAPGIGQRNKRLPSAYSNLPRQSFAPLLTVNSSKKSKHYKNSVQNGLSVLGFKNIQGGVGKWWVEMSW